MKDIVLLIEKKHVEDFVRSIWKTAMFRSLQDVDGSPVNETVRDFARLPRIFFEMSDPRAERAHFSAWWGAIPFRQYDNDVVHDLYLLHEMKHAGTMRYVPGVCYESWKGSMTDNELMASVLSEVEIYFHLGIRELSFPHAIYADEFLGDEGFLAVLKDDRSHARDLIRLRRRDVMLNDAASKGNDVRYWIHRFNAQNDAWAAIWSHRYDEVNVAMHEITLLSIAGKRNAAAEKLKTWLTGEHTTLGTGIPFPEEANAFAGVYWASRSLYERTFKPSPRQNGKTNGVTT
jgi:hypothetical protein